MSLAIDIADAVAAELNAAPAGTFTPDFEAVRRVLPEFDLKDLAELRVCVVPRSVTITNVSRMLSQHEVAVDVGVQRKLGADIDTEVKTLGGLVDAICGYLTRRALAQAPQAVWIGTENDPVYAPAHLAEQRVFTSVLTVTYRSIG